MTHHWEKPTPSQFYRTDFWKHDQVKFLKKCNEKAKWLYKKKNICVQPNGKLITVIKSILLPNSWVFIPDMSITRLRCCDGLNRLTNYFFWIHLAFKLNKAFVLSQDSKCSISLAYWQYHRTTWAFLHALERRHGVRGKERFRLTMTTGMREPDVGVFVTPFRNACLHLKAVEQKSNPRKNTV